MGIFVNDGSSDSKELRLSLKNRTKIDIVFLIGEKSFTMAPGQYKQVRAEPLTSIEARPQLIGIDSCFLVGGVKKDSVLECGMVESPDSASRLVLQRTDPS